MNVRSVLGLAAHKGESTYLVPPWWGRLHKARVPSLQAEDWGAVRGHSVRVCVCTTPHWDEDTVIQSTEQKHEEMRFSRIYMQAGGASSSPVLRVPW